MPSQPRRANTRKPKLSIPLSLTDLERIKQASKKKHGTAANTTRSYNGYIQRGKQWLTDLVNGVTNQNTFECPRGSLESGENTAWKWTSGDLEHAFNPIPTRASPWALASFISVKCFEENLGASTADGIQAAFKKYWDNSDPEGKYRGEWKWNEGNGVGTGNPAASVDVMDTVHAVKKKHGAENQRTHSSAMSYNILQKIYTWSLQVIPASFDLPEVNSLPAQERLLLHKHLGWRAFSSFSWTLWTRNFETLNIQRRHFLFNCRTNDEFQIPHWRISLEHRKNWQNKLGQDQELRGHVYQIYPQSDLPAADLDFHMRNWLVYLEHVYGRTLLPTDWIFPSISSNGIIQQQSPMSHDTIQRWINEFAAGAGIDNSEAYLTTHCFRRGGAQYRFMYAPIGKRWTLATIRWWGGWAEGEHRDTLIRYLLDELHYYEEGHGDALRPIQTEAHISFMGEHREQQAVTLGDMKTIATSLEATITAKVIGDITSTLTTFLKEERPVPDILHLLRSHTCSSGTGPGSRISRKGEHAVIASTKNPGAITTMVTSRTDSNPLPLIKTKPFPPGLYLPNIPASVPPAERWKMFIRHWYFPDPSIGHNVALKDWEITWTKDLTFAMKYTQRKLVATEFEKCEKNEELFLQHWPEAKKGTTPLVDAIRQARIARGEARSRQRKHQNLK